LTPLANGLFHRWVAVRESAIDILLSLQNFQVSWFFEQHVLQHFEADYGSSVDKRW
jgi:hypothetical protein